jgi:hypothetical protein
MSLLRLLTTGRSLVGIRDSENRYRMTNQRLLPKFESAKNPFRAVDGKEINTKHELPNTEYQAPDRNCQTSNAGLCSREAEAEVKPTAAAASRERQTEAASPQVGAKGAGAVRRVTARCRQWAAAALPRRWASGLSSWLKPRTRQPTKAVPVFGKPPVQAELSMDRIQVVRNDLSDADLEVVPAKRRAQTVAAPVVRRGELAEGPILRETSR